MIGIEKQRPEAYDQGRSEEKMLNKVNSTKILLFIVLAVSVLFAGANKVYGVDQSYYNLCENLKDIEIEIGPQNPTSQDEVYVTAKWLYHATTSCVHGSHAYIP